MRFLFVNGPDFVDHTLFLLEEGHDVVFVHVNGQDTPFGYKVNFANANRDQWVKTINDFAETHNTFEKHKERYTELCFQDLDEIYGNLEDLINEFSPDHIIRAKRDFEAMGFDFIC